MCNVEGQSIKVKAIKKLINQKYAENFAYASLNRLVTSLLSINKHNFFLKSDVDTDRTCNWLINPCYKFFFDCNQLDEFKLDVNGELDTEKNRSKRPRLHLVEEEEYNQIRPLIKPFSIKYINVVFKDSERLSYKCPQVCVCIVKALQLHSELNVDQIYEFINETYVHQFSKIERRIRDVLNKYPFFVKDEENFWKINSDYSIKNEFIDIIDMVVAAFEDDSEPCLSVGDVLDFIRRNYPDEKINYNIVYGCLQRNACFIQIENGKEKSSWILDTNFKRISLQERSIECFQNDLLDSLLENDRYSHQEMVDINLFDLDEAFRE